MGELVGRRVKSEKTNVRQGDKSMESLKQVNKGMESLGLVMRAWKVWD